mmetsp:Transcript_39224/g.77115  ORF Transcript_39224/g.77115 Transcript_39224/m.77115 type:complete len:94 (+) Transcript_39224:159-440(+)
MIRVQTVLYQLRWQWYILSLRKVATVVSVITFPVTLRVQFFGLWIEVVARFHHILGEVSGLWHIWSCLHCLSSFSCLALAVAITAAVVNPAAC